MSSLITPSTPQTSTTRAASPSPSFGETLDRRDAAEDDTLDNTHYSSLSESELPNVDFDSDDDEAGIFFGAHNPIERKLVASLSRSIPSSPASRNISGIAGPAPRRSSLVNHRGINKRDSREFVRRKTLIHGELEKTLASCGENKAAEAGEGAVPVDRSPRQDQWPGEAEAGPSSQPIAGPSTAPATIPVQILDVTPEEEMPSFDVDEHMLRNDPITDDETDKENTMVPEAYYGSDEDASFDSYNEMATWREADKPITLGFSSVGHDEITSRIDMGGLSILDFDDPDLGPLEDTSIACDHGDAEESDLLIESVTGGSVLDEPSRSSPSHASFLENPFVAMLLSTPSTPAKANKVDLPVAGSPFAASASPQHPPPVTAATPIRGTPLKRTPLRTMLAEAPSADSSYDSELDSPIMARGRTVIPLFNVASPAGGKHAPLRGLEPSQDLAPPPAATPEMTMALPSLDSPTSRIIPAITPHRLAPSLAPLPKTPASARAPVRTPPSRVLSPRVPASLGPNRALHMSSEVQVGDVDRARRRVAKAEARAKEQAAALRRQLDVIVSSKMASFSPVKGSSGPEAKPIPSSVSKPTRAEMRNTDKSPAVPRPTLKPLKSALKNPLNAPAVNGLPDPKAACGGGATGIPRPVARRPLTASHRTATVAERAVPPQEVVSLIAPLNTPRATATPLGSLKRPFSAIQPQSERPAAVCTRASSLASRLPARERDTPSTSFFPVPGPPSALSAPPVRSPPPVQAQRASVLGKPVRPMMTPTMQRTAPTPSHATGPAAGVACTPLKQPPVRPMLLTGSAKKSEPKITPLSRSAARPTALAMGASRGTPLATGASRRTPLAHTYPGARVPPAPLMPRLSEHHGEAAADADANADADLDLGTSAAAQETPGSDKVVETEKIPEPEAAALKPDEKMDVDGEESPSLVLPQVSRLERPAHVPATHVPSDTGASAESGPSAVALDNTSANALVSNGEPESQDANGPRVKASPSPTPAPTTAAGPSSPTLEARGTRRSARTMRAPPRAPPLAAPRPKPAAVPTIVPGMSERELLTATKRNTQRNQVYLCSIDRQIVRVAGPRPPSPTSKIAKTADREEEERRAERSARASRRRRVVESDDSSEPEDAQDARLPAVERVPFVLPSSDDEGGALGGDSAAPASPGARPAKRARLASGNSGSGSERSRSPSAAASRSRSSSSAENAKRLRWNRSLTLIRGGLGELEHSPTPPATSRSALKPDAARIPLDAHGNVVDRPVERLKRLKVAVRAVFYDGEEPAPFNYNVGQGGTGKKGKGRK